MTLSLLFAPSLQGYLFFFSSSFLCIALSPTFNQWKICRDLGNSSYKKELSHFITHSPPQSPFPNPLPTRGKTNHQQSSPSHGCHTAQTLLKYIATYNFIDNISKGSIGKLLHFITQIVCSIIDCQICSNLFGSYVKRSKEKN